MKTISINLSLALVILISSCASIMSTSKQTVGFSSNPQKASVFVDNMKIGDTPISSSLLRKREHTVRIELEGYLPYETTLTKKLNGWFFGNILIGGLIGVVVDASTGAMYTLTPESIKTTLDSKGVSLKNQENTLLISVALKEDTSLFVPENRIGYLKK